MQGNHTLIATTSFYRSEKENRFQYACRLAQNAIDNGYHMVMVDGSPDPVIAERFQTLGASVFKQESHTMGGSRREVFTYLYRHATHFDTVVWTEPEKYDIVRWIPKIIAPILDGNARVSVPRRSKKSWETYPKFQQASESIGNRVFREVTGIDADVFFGPVAFNADVLHIFATCDPKKWGAEDTYIQHYALAKVFSAGFPIHTAVAIDFEYPHEQKKEEEGDANISQMIEKRLWQLDSLIDGYFKIMKHLELK